ncbi:hypothetical protein AHAS_Ahas09G0152700 [Arachis hypogaea]
MALKETFYISHGSPELEIEDSVPAWKFLKSWKECFLIDPQPFLWYLVSGTTVNVVDGHNDSIYYFYGFPMVMNMFV